MNSWTIKFRAKGSQDKWRIAKHFSSVKEALNAFNFWKATEEWADFELIQTHSREFVIGR